MMKESLIHAWVDGYNTRNWEAVKNLYADDALIHSKDGPMKGG